MCIPPKKNPLNRKTTNHFGSVPFLFRGSFWMISEILPVYPLAPVMVRWHDSRQLGCCISPGGQQIPSIEILLFSRDPYNTIDGRNPTPPGMYETL